MYIEAFLAESDRHLTALETAGLRLEREEPSEQLFVDMSLHVRVLKNMSIEMRFIQLLHLAHGLELVLERIRSTQEGNKEHLNKILFAIFDRIRQHLDSVQMYGQEAHLDERSFLCSFSLFNLWNQQFSSQRSEEDLLKLYMKFMYLAHKLVYRIRIELRNGCEMPTARLLLVYQTIKEKGELVASFPEETEIWRGRAQLEAKIVAYLDPLTVPDLCLAILHITDVATCDFEMLSK
ncbi:MAG: hypothetical protein K6T83_07150 [Alicyclobacillus sp.]|nr:hypothetical protein [Alicyclobacillus sp.]